MSKTPTKPLDRALLRIVRYGLFGVFILPFVIRMDLLYPWVTGKAWGFEIIVEALFPLYVLLALRRKEYRPAPGPLLWALLAYFAVAAVAMLLGEDPFRSFWSKPDRLTGLFFQYHLLAFFLMAGSVWRGMTRWPAAVSTVVAALLAVHAALQAWFSLGQAGERGAATFGNASYFGQYLVPHVFLAAWLLWRDRASWRSFIWLFSGGLILLGIFASKSRGALIGLIAGAMIAAVIGAVRGSAATKKWAAAGLFVLAAAIGAYVIADRIPSTHQWLYDQRLSVQYFKETQGPRTLLLENAVKGFKSRPLFGWGPENFESAYYRNYDPRTLRYSEYETRQDRPHNLVMELLATVGAIGFLAYAAVVFFAVRLALSERAAVLAISLASLLATNLFLFETPASYLVFYLLLSLIAASAPSAPAAGEDEASQGAVPAFLAVAAVSIWAFWAGVGSAIVPEKIANALIVDLAAAPPSPEEFVRRFDELKSSRTPLIEDMARNVAAYVSRVPGEYLVPAYAPAMADVALFLRSRSDRRKNDYVHALATATAALSVQPPRPPELQAALEESVKSMRRLTSRRQEVEWIDAQILTEKNDDAGAERAYLAAIDDDPAALLPHGRYVRFLLRRRKMDQAMEHLKKNPETLREGSETLYPLLLETRRFFDDKRYDDVYALYQASMRHEVPTMRWMVSGAVAALRLGKAEEAGRIIEEAKKLFSGEIQTIDLVYNGQLEEWKREQPAR